MMVNISLLYLCALFIITTLSTCALFIMERKKCLKLEVMLFSFRVESRVPLTNEDIAQSHTSRYQTEFTELGKIGKGGFGSVFKVCFFTVSPHCTTTCILNTCL